MRLRKSSIFPEPPQKLHISQPALTKRIAELEDRLGLALFERDRQIVDVNDSGRAFVEEARLSVLHGERAFQAARTVARGVDVVLNVGRSPYTDPFSRFDPALNSIAPIPSIES